MGFAKNKLKYLTRFAWVFLLAGSGLLVFSLISASKDDPFVVVLDPGHGGLTISPKELYGDKFNPLTNKFADHFRPGAYSFGLAEHEEVYEIAYRAKKLLDLTKTEAGRKQFHQILKKYNKRAAFPKGTVEVHLSRGASYQRQYKKIKDDLNGPYRMFDYPDVKSGETKPGRLSRINKLKPHMVVSIHLNGGGNPRNGAVGSVITPSHQTYKKAIAYVKGSASQRQRIRDQFMKGPYRGWIDSCGRRTRFQQFLCDAWIYYTGYWSKKNGLSPDLNIFRGYRHNLVSWRYADSGDWFLEAKRHRPNSPYSRSLRNIKLEGPFWQRERRQEERWRRENGPEGYGGDNLYASQEILRYVRKSLLVNKVDTYRTLPVMKSPYLSTWTIPTYVNAITAFLEIGYLTSKRDSQRILGSREVYAEAIAVGVYSLCYSLKQPKSNKRKQLPVGKQLDFAKYKDYFSKT